MEKILEYQKLDGRIMALKRDFEKNESRVTLNKLVSVIKDSQLKLIELETKAKSFIEEYNKSRATYETNYDIILELSKIDINKLSEEELNTQIEKTNKLSNILTSLERTLSSQAESIGNIIKNFEICRSNIMSYKQKYKEVKDKVEDVQKDLIQKVEEIKKEMSKLESGIDSKLILKYKHLRQDKIFPVFVPLNNNACGGCSMEISSALMNKLKANGYLECEQCHRYIYTN